MATYVRFEPHMDPSVDDPAPRCDSHSRFDTDGFPLPLDDGKRRCWDPMWGGPCEEPGCGKPC